MPKEDKDSLKNGTFRECPRCNRLADDFETCHNCEETVCTMMCIAGKMVMCFMCEEGENE